MSTLPPVGRGDGTRKRSDSGPYSIWKNTFQGIAVWNVQNSALNFKTWQENSTVIPPERSAGLVQYASIHTSVIAARSGRIKPSFFVSWDQVLYVAAFHCSFPTLTPCARNGIFRFFDNVINGNAAIPNSSTRRGPSTLPEIRVESWSAALCERLRPVARRIYLPANADCSNIASLVMPHALGSKPHRFDSTGICTKRLINSDLHAASKSPGYGRRVEYGRAIAGYGGPRKRRSRRCFVPGNRSTESPPDQRQSGS